MGFFLESTGTSEIMLSGGSNAMFSVIPAIIVLGFIVVIGIVVFRIAKGGMEWNSNNNSPILTVGAKVVTKRTAVRGHGHMQGSINNNMHHHTATTTYFVTFEVESGDRMELKVRDKEYGLLAEGDAGKLTFQGTRYKGFDRIMHKETSI